jgi:ferrous iron transport protein B
MRTGRGVSAAVIALGGNPNVGKSSVFNALTGLRQHTGNWHGKTVTTARGYCKRGQNHYVLVDLPGCYSLGSHSAEEEVSRDFICSGEADAVVIVCDATCLERSLSLVMQTLEITKNVVVCVNLMDEAQKKGIKINLEALSARLVVPVVGTSARSGKGIDALLEAIDRVIENSSISSDRERLPENEEERMSVIMLAAESICKDVVVYENVNYRDRDARLDGILAGRWTAFPIMLLALLGIFWITIVGANYPSELLSTLFFHVEGLLLVLCAWMPEFLRDMLIFGVYRVLAWVVAVMLPPMAIFFPLFTLLEDAGFLPRVAFNLDKVFKKCSACGKQALTMCIGNLCYQQKTACLTILKLLYSI